MIFDEEISFWWCLGDTWRCTPSEAAGLWSVVLFYTSAIFVTIIHVVIQGQNGTEIRNDEATRRHRKKTDDISGEFRLVCSLLVYFFAFAAGCLVWATAGVRYAHPFQCWQIQTYIWTLNWWRMAMLWNNI